MVAVGNRETNLVAMVAVKANSVKLPYDVVRISNAKQCRKCRVAVDSSGNVYVDDISNKVLCRFPFVYLGSRFPFIVYSSIILTALSRGLLIEVM